MYWSSVIHLLSWPLLIAVSYLAIHFTLKKLSLLDKGTETAEKQD